MTARWIVAGGVVTSALVLSATSSGVQAERQAG